MLKTLSGRLAISIAIPTIGVLISLVLLIFSIRLLSAARAYVGGESLWAKSQKEITYNLHRYSHTRSEDYYNSALKAADVPLGDKQARLELNKENPEKSVIVDGFLRGGIHPDDIDGMIYLYRNFKSVSYLARPISIWEQGDEVMSELLQEAELLREDILNSAPESVIAARLTRIDDIDNRLTILEKDFSESMGVASRWVGTTLIMANSAVILIILALSLLFSRSLNKKSVKEIASIRESAETAAAGDYSHKVEGIETVELKSTAEALNTLTARVSDTTTQLKNSLEESEKDRQNLENSKLAMFNILDDLAEEKQNQNETIAKDEAILHGIGDGLVATDKDGCIVLTNPAFSSITGWSLEEVEGKRLSDILPILDDSGKPINEYSDQVEKTLSQMTTDIITTAENTYFKRKNETLFPVTITLSPIIRDKSVTGVVMVFHDATKEKEIDRAKSEFVSLASHQLRTPLTAINWYTDMLMAGDAGKLSAEQTKYLQEIQMGNKRMVELVNALLNVSRIELGTFMIEPEETDLVELCKKVVKESEPKIFERRQDFKENYDKLPAINVDPKLMRIIVENLVSNAIKYTPVNGSVSLSVLDKVNEVEIQVKDTGYGIPKEQQPKIFGKLFRADNVKEHDTEGTGLGLYIVKSVVESSGGKVWFESEKDKGTTFFVTLPKSGMKPREGSRQLD